MTVLEAGIDTLKYEIGEEAPHRASIKVVGVGGGGANAVAHMMHAGLEGVEFYVIDTDVQALAASPVRYKLAIGAQSAGGRAAGGDPEVGRQAALDDTERILEVLTGAEMVFITAGLGAGVGTGAAPVIASLARQMNAVTVAVVTKPFSLEGPRPVEQAEKGLAELAATVDTVIAVPNDRLLALAPRGASVVDAFRMGYDLLRQTVENIVELNTTAGLINRDFSYVRAVLQGTGRARMGSAVVTGENAMVEAARQAINCPLLEEAGIFGARRILLNVTASSRLPVHELAEACALIRKAAACDDLELSLGLVLNEALGEAVKVTVIAGGFPGRETPAASAQEQVAEAYTAPPPEPEPPPPPPLEPPEPLDELDIPAYLRQGKRMAPA